MGVNIEDSVDKVKVELKEYIDERMMQSEDTNKKKILDIESSIRRLNMGDSKSPTAVGRGKGRLGKDTRQNSMVQRGTLYKEGADPGIGGGTPGRGRGRGRGRGGADVSPAGRGGIGGRNPIKRIPSQ